MIQNTYLGICIQSIKHSHENDKFQLVIWIFYLYNMKYSDI